MEGLVMTKDNAAHDIQIKREFVTEGEDRAVAVKKLENGSFVLRFTKDKKPEDFRNGKPCPAARAVVEEDKIVTFMRITPEAMKALRAILNEISVG